MQCYLHFRCQKGFVIPGLFSVWKTDPGGSLSVKGCQPLVVKVFDKLAKRLWVRHPSVCTPAHL